MFSRVQGVGFRYYIREKANNLGVMGFIQNKYDGSVLIEAEAEENILNVFIDYCYEGSPLSSVKQVAVTQGVIKNYTSFIVK